MVRVIATKCEKHAWPNVCGSGAWWAGSMPARIIIYKRSCSELLPQRMCEAVQSHVHIEETTYYSILIFICCSKTAFKTCLCNLLKV